MFSMNFIVHKLNFTYFWHRDLALNLLLISLPICLRHNHHIYFLLTNRITGVMLYFAATGGYVNTAAYPPGIQATYPQYPYPPQQAAPPSGYMPPPAYK